MGLSKSDDAEDGSMVVYEFHLSLSTLNDGLDGKEDKEEGRIARKRSSRRRSCVVFFLSVLFVLLEVKS